jgi:gliding motility-associated-like protein
MNRYLIIAFILLSQVALFAQNSCVVFFEISSATSSTVNVDVKANGFTGVIGFQMYVKWNASVLSKMAVTNANPALSGLSFGGGQLGDDIQSAQWFDINGVGVSLPAGATLFTIQYEYVGQPCAESFMILTDPDAFRKSLITYASNEQTDYPMNYTPGNIQIPGDDCNGGQNGDDFGVGLLIDEVFAPTGSQVCVPIRVDSFVNIASLNFSVTWDPDCISYVSVQNNYAEQQGVSDIGTNVINNNTFIYSMATINPLNLPDGGILIEICFLVLAPDGQVCPITFSNQLPVEVTGEGGVLPHYTDNGAVNVGDYNPVTFTVVDNDSAPKGGTVCVDITGTNFSNIETIQYIFKWNPAILKWKGLGTVNNIGINDGPTGHISLYGNDGIKVSWSDPQGKSVADGNILYQLCFDVLGDCNQTTQINIIGEPGFEIEITSNEVAMPYLIVPGTVTVECTFPEINIEKHDVMCNGGSDGRIIITLVGASVSDYNFKWYKGATLLIDENGRNTYQGITAGLYRIVITEIADPTKSEEREVLINEPAAIVINHVQADVTCESKGSITLSVAGGNPGYTYQWNPAAIGNNPNATNLGAGQYSVTVTDSKGCPSVNKSFVIVSKIPALAATIFSFKDITCKDANNAEIEITVTGGCTPIAINWSDGAGAGQIKRSGLAAGNYKVTVTDDAGQTIELSFSVTNPANELVLNTQVTEGLAGSINLTVAGGQSPYTFNWSGPGQFASTNQNISNLEKGIYFVTVTDARGCIKTTQAELLGIITELEVVVNVNTQQYNGFGVRCAGDCNGLITASVVANIPYKVFLNGTEITLPYNNVCAGVHVLRIQDAQGFIKEATFTVTEPPALSVRVLDSVCENQGKEDAFIEVSASGGVPSYIYNWGITGLNTSVATGLTRGDYSVTITDRNACTVISEKISIEYCFRGECFRGTVIVTPNGDGFNDYFAMTCSDDLRNNYLYIYDRLGNEVFRQADYDGTWNGLDSNGNQLPEDAYMWVFTGKNEAGIREVYKGTVTLLR